MKCDIKQFVDAAVAEEHLYGKFLASVSYRTGIPEVYIIWPNRFSFKSKEYADPQSIDYKSVDVPNARWHENHTFTCFAFPTYTEENCEQIGDALRKIISAFSK